MGEEIHDVELDYPLEHHARTLLQIGPDFVKPVDNDVPIDEEQKMRDFDINSEENKEDTDLDLGAEAYGPDVDDDINEA